MSRVTKWKIEKAKVKVVFRLQFHATLIPQSGWEKLFISFIPTETGKATAKTSKANVRNGSCKWADPIYETTRLLFDSKTKQYDDKLYKLVVGMGTSRSSILGEATINLADYADASQPSAIALPLHGTDHGTILHVTVQLLTAKTGFREFEQQRDKGLQRESESVTVKSSSSSDLQIPDDLVNKAKTRVQIHEEYSDSQVTCDESSNASEKVDFNEVDSIKSRLSSSQTSPTEKMNGPDRAKLAQTSDSDRLMDADMAIVYEENLRLRGSLEVAESSISELKTELTALQNHANEMGTKTEKITQELVTEIASSQELVKEVNVLKSECLKLKNDLQQLKETKSSSNFTENMVQFGEIPKLPLQELDTAKAEKENLVKKMDQMECYYESLVQELEENQKKILGEFQHLKNEHSTYKAETESLTSVNNELQKRATSAESALKRARLNYSIAVGQLQKDLDVLSFQVLSMFETNQTVIKEAFTDTSQPSPKHLSDDLKKSLSLQENIYKKVEEELGELCSANLQLDVYSGTLEETLYESSAHIRKMNENFEKLVEKLQILDQSRVYYVSKCNDLHLQNQMLETDLGNLSNDNFVLMEKITESEALLMDYKVYKGKHDQVSTQNQNLEKDMLLLNQELETLQREKDSAEVSLSTATSAIKNLEKDLVSVKLKFKNDLHEVVAKMENPNLCLERIEMLIDSVGNKLKSGFESGEQKNEAFLSYLSSLEIELQKMSFEDKNFQEQIVSLDLMAQEFEKSNQDLRFLNDELSVEKNELEGTVASLTFELESQRLELENVRKLASDQENEKEARYIKENENLVKNLESIKLELEASIAQNLKVSDSNEEHALKVDQLKDMLTKAEVEIGQLQTKLHDSESRLNLYLENESRYVEENRNLALEVDQLKDMLTKTKANVGQLQTKLNDSESKLKLYLENEAHYVEENRNFALEVDQLKGMLTTTEANVGQLQTKLHDSESRLELYLENESRYVEENSNLALEVDQLKDLLTKTESNVGQLQTELHDSESKLKFYLENEARYVEENSNLATKLESLKLELEASIAHTAKSLESKNEHVLEVDQLKDMLTKSKTEVGQLQMKLNDSESRLKLYLENEARYTEENRNLLTEIESVRLKLDASIADNAECLESKNEYALEVDQQKDMLTKSKTEVDQLKDMLTKSKTEVDQLKDMLTKSKTEVDQLNDMLTKSKTEVDQLKELEMKLLDTKEKLDHRITNEARYIEENKSLKSELDAIIAHNAEISEALTKSKSEVDELKELEMKLLDTESRLNHCLEKEAHYIKENENLVTRFESVRLQLEASIAHNAEISEALTKSKSEAEPLKELEIKLLDTESRLNHCLEKEARYIEENKNLTTRYESVRLQLEASIAHNAEISEALTKSKSEIDQTKEKLDHQIETETHYIEENESLKLKLDAIIAQKANNDEDCTLISREKSEIILLLLKAKLDEQNDELTALQNKCNDLTNRLSEQILKTEEFKNLSKYLKDLKDNADVAREKKDPKGPVESLQMAFIKEQHQTKIQELKQQLSVSKKHNEEMLFKLQDALDEIESRKKSESLQLRRIEELETEIQSVNSVKPDYDRLQAELECAVLSLECCKEEKEKLVDLLQECEDEKSKITVEFSLVKEQLAQKEENGFTGLNGSVNPEIEQAIQEDEENSLVNDSRQLMVVNDQFRSQHLKSCMEQLDQELEKMKNVNNSLLPLTNYDPSFQDLQSELAQLHQANEELGSIYPNFVDFAGNGNALERVLALEIELAEALRSKKKSSISSFLKQHSDEEAVFKSFRDINELIKEMLEIKGKYVNVENELKEMHDRYSQLSLQFAEVEGERQKLMMTLKNVRSSRNLLRLNRSSMAVIEDNPL